MLPSPAPSLVQTHDLFSGKVVVIVPVFNLERSLEECLDSILRQSYQNFILIAINDGSSDKSLEILEKYRKKDSRIIVINQENKGVPNARNAGLNLAEKINGVEYISFVDGDDFIDADFLNAHIETLEKTQADISICGYEKFGNVEKAEKKHFFLGRYLTQLDFLSMVFSYGEWKSTYGSGGMVWKHVYRLSTIRGSRFYDDREVVEDELFCVNIARLTKKYAYIPRNLYYYRISAGTLTKQNNIGKKLAIGRQFCLDGLEDFHGLSRDIILYSFLMSVRHFVVDGYDISNLKRYVKYVIMLYRRKMIDWKTAKRFLIFCYMPNLARKMYNVEKCIRKWKNHVKVFVKMS